MVIQNLKDAIRYAKTWEGKRNAEFFLQSALEGQEKAAKLSEGLNRGVAAKAHREAAEHLRMALRGVQVPA